MRMEVEKSNLLGAVSIPPSKSHTIRAVAMASLADGTSEILSPLDSEDTKAAVRFYRALGAKIHVEPSRWIVEGAGEWLVAPENVIDVGNSGTTCRIGMGSAAMCRGYSVITGDEQTRRRPMESLLNALNDLGAEAFSTRGDGHLPVVIGGRLKGGEASVEGITSQFLTSLLINCPLAPDDTIVHVSGLRERPYVDMTLRWLEKQEVMPQNDDYERFTIPGGRAYLPFTDVVPADFSSATFFLCAAAITNSRVMLHGLDMEDPQGDKEVVNYLAEMGADVEVTPGGVRVRGADLRGIELDLEDTPDALPALAVVGCFAWGETILRNVPQARIKETDRISLMAKNLRLMGAQIEELPDGLFIRPSVLRGATVDGAGDHRVVMALAVAGLRAQGTTCITGAEAINVTFPTFPDLMNELGARVRLVPG
ncbi:MAG: 3-phosphoshikimate 1-carboxyvinyltransferase [Nitrospinota bacterium]